MYIQRFISWLCTKQSWAVMIAFLFNNDNQEKGQSRPAVHYNVKSMLPFWSIKCHGLSAYFWICHLCYFFDLINVMICQHILTYLSFMLLFCFINVMLCQHIMYWFFGSFYGFSQSRVVREHSHKYDVRWFWGIFDLPTLIRYFTTYISLFSKIRCSLTYPTV